MIRRINPSAPDSTPSLLCQIDSVAQHAHALFGFGWALDHTGVIVGGHLRLAFADGSEQSVLLALARARPDVANAYPDHPQAGRAGFMFMAGWGERPPVKAELCFDLADGRQQHSALPLASGNNPLGTTPAPTQRRYLLRRTLEHLRQGRILELLHKGVRRLRTRARPASQSGQQLAALLDGQRCRLVIDHAMGGGANLFREQQVAHWLAAGDTVVLLSFRLASMQPFIEVRNRRGSLTLTLQRYDELVGVLANTTLAEIFFNCAVSFPDAAQIQRLVLTLQRQLAAPLTVAVHEYFLACPSPFLLNANGRFCGIPALERCRTCLPVHGDGFASLTGERSIDHWRHLWGELLEAADEVRCFSESTRGLLARAYPVMSGRMTLRPHSVAPLRPVHLARDPMTPLTVGVLGMISPHKGAQVVADLAQAVVETGANVRIVVLGTLDAIAPSEVIEQVGPYQRSDLPELIEKHRIDIALLPSICPETFSFVAHEIAAMQLPLLCLDLGAQADLARSLRAGWVAARQDGPGLLEEIIAFDRHLHPLRLRVLV